MAKLEAALAEKARISCKIALSGYKTAAVAAAKAGVGYKTALAVAGPLVSAWST